MRKSQALFLTAAAVMLATGLFHSLSSSGLQQEFPKEIISAFSEWKQRFGRVYSTPAEEIHRLSVFADSYNKVKQVNSEGLSYTLELNRFADMQPKEFSSKFLKARVGKQSLKASEDSMRHVEDLRESLKAGIPDQVDWHKAGRTSKVKDQEDCGGCYAFATTSCIEAHLNIANRFTGALSPQDIIDCSWSMGNEGCDGGWNSDVFAHIIKRGVNYEKDYPYKNKDGKCKHKDSNHIKIKDYVELPESINNRDVMAAIARGPAAVAIDGDNLQLYRGGIFNKKCSSEPNHAVLLVGYGEDSSGTYWKIQNSWGPSWGEEGFIRMTRPTSNTKDYCTIAKFVSYPIV